MNYALGKMTECLLKLFARAVTMQNRHFLKLVIVPYQQHEQDNDNVADGDTP